jgi:hypothetical protein
MAHLRERLYGLAHKGIIRTHRVMARAHGYLAEKSNAGNFAAALASFPVFFVCELLFRAGWNVGMRRWALLDQRSDALTRQTFAPAWAALLSVRKAL